MAALPKTGPGSSKIEMSFTIENIPGVEIEIASILADSIDKAFKKLSQNFQDLIIDPLILGGGGWKPLIKTAAYKWLTSPKGYAELGFTNALTPLVLLSALRKSWDIKVISRRTGKTINTGVVFNWANLEEIYRATEHPAAGKQGLPSGRSWFEWLYAGLPLKEDGFHFKKTGPAPGVRSSSIAGADAGRMVAGGFWQVKPRFRVDLDKLWSRNEKKITRVIENYISNQITLEVGK